MCNPILDFQGLAGCQASWSHYLMHIGVTSACEKMFLSSWLILSKTLSMAGIARACLISLVVQNVNSNWLSEKENKLRCSSVENNGFVVFFVI